MIDLFPVLRSLFLLAFVSAAPAWSQDCAILLHGLARTSGSMSEVGRVLTNKSYYVVNADYPSRDFPIDVLAESTIPDALRACPDTSTVHFVTHSMGGILVRYYLSQHPVERLGRVVMMGPPNGGSEVVDKLRNVPGFGAINGQAGDQLGTDTTSVPVQLGPATFEVGIIAGSRSISPILSALLPGPDDGKVAVAQTCLEGMTDHLVLPVTHTFMMRNGSVLRQIVRFLETGAFDDEKGERGACDRASE